VPAAATILGLLGSLDIVAFLASYRAEGGVNAREDEDAHRRRGATAMGKKRGARL
jgi:hypothetical protein